MTGIDFSPISNRGMTDPFSARHERRTSERCQIMQGIVVNNQEIGNPAFFEQAIIGRKRHALGRIYWRTDNLAT